MSLEADPDRFRYEDNRPNAYERDKAERKLAAAEKLLEDFRIAARACAEGLNLLGLLDTENWPPHGSTADEVIEGAADEVEGLYHSLLHGERYAELKATARGEE